jgi:hypothetical protein
VTDTRQRIVEQNRYRPSDPALAHRGYLPASSARGGVLARETIKLPGDKVIDERGHCYEV